ncbi:MAG: chromosome partitioning protein ParB, partial [Rubrimonas sp.]
MARRRRLEPPAGADLDSIRAAAAASAGAAPFPVLPAPPIAQVAADAGVAALRDIEAGRAAVARLAEAEAEGLLLLDLPLDRIDVDYLARDRLPRAAEGEDWQALKASLQTHGQRTPIEVAPLADDDDGAPEGQGAPYGLISGYRRVAALRRLHEETGDPRFSRAKAVVRRAASLGQAFVAMVEENEIREGISYFERARVCLRAVEHGAFADVDAALNVLFAAASPAKRSKIRSFQLVVEELGDLLVFPQSIGERLGLRLAAALKAGRGGALRRSVAEAPAPATPEAEQAVLTRALAAAPAVPQTGAHRA